MQRSSVKIVICALAALSFTLLTSIQAYANGDVFADTFRLTTIKSEWHKEIASNRYACQVSGLYGKSGMSLRMELRPTDPLVYGSKRAELSLVKKPAPAQNQVYRVSIMLPKGGNEDYALDPHGSEIITQWHNTPDSGEPWTTPPLALKTYNGRYIITMCWDDAPITSNSQMTKKGYRKTIDLGPYEPDKGKFVDWVFRIKWGWKYSQQPRLRVYKNDIKVLDYSGPNTTNDQVGNVMKIGIYKWDWAQNKTFNHSIVNRRVIYYDNILVRTLQ